jgi:hypothetical protein
LLSDLSGERDAIANDLENERWLKNNEAKRARAAEKTCGVQQALADNRYEKLQAPEDEISDLQSQLDEVHEQLKVASSHRSSPASSSDETVGTVDNLSGLLEDILAHETAKRRLNNLPKEASPSPLRMRTLKDLGTPSIDAEELAGWVRAAPQYPFPPRTRVPILPPPSHPQALFDADELKEKAERSGDGVWRPAFQTTLRTSSRSARPPSPRSSTRRSRSAGRTSTATPESASFSLERGQGDQGRRRRD